MLRTKELFELVSCTVFVYYTKALNIDKKKKPWTVYIHIIIFLGFIRVNVKHGQLHNSVKHSVIGFYLQLQFFLISCISRLIKVKTFFNRNLFI